jgi:putative transposase
VSPNPLTDSEGHFYDLPEVVRTEVALCDQRKERLQGKLSRQKKGSKNRGRTKKRIARTNARKSNLLEDWRQKTANRVLAKAHRVIGMEKLHLANLTAAPEPKPNPVAEIPGQRAFLPNGASAKAGLNKALLKVGLGALRSLIGQKAGRAGKAFLLVPPQFSSQECSQCTHTSPDNRLAQAEFHCQACGYVAHADYNASLVQRKRAGLLLSQHRPPGIGSRSSRKGAKLLGRERRPSRARTGSPFPNVS